MAEGRMIKKRIAKSQKIASLKTHMARVLYFMVLPHLDVKGRHEADGYIIKGNIVPYIKSFTPQRIKLALLDLQRVGLIVLYRVNDEDFLQYIRFEDFQTLQPDREARSVIPEPPKEELQRNSRGTPDEVTTNSKISLSLSKDKFKYKSNTVTSITHPPFVNLTKEELHTLVDTFGESTIKLYISKINDYIASTGKKPYKDYAATLRNWLRKDNVPIKKKPFLKPKKEERSENIPNLSSKLKELTKDVG